MKRFEFKLSKVLELKNYKEDEAKTELGRIRGILDREIRKKEEFGEELEVSRVELKQARAGLGIQDVQHYYAYFSGLKNLVKRQNGVIENIRGQERTAVQGYLKARKERSILDKLREKQEVRHNKQAARKEKIELDEIALNMHLRKPEIRQAVQKES